MGQFYGAAGTEPLEPPAAPWPPEPPKSRLKPALSRLSRLSSLSSGAAGQARCFLVTYAAYRRCWAWDDTQLAGVGCLLVSCGLRSGLTRSLYLKELYVGPARTVARASAKLLMDSLREVAAATGCSRLEWTTDETMRLPSGFTPGSAWPVRTSKLFYRVELGQRDSG